jgi:Ca2+-binding RTX toxin-like protein
MNAFLSRILKQVAPKVRQTKQIARLARARRVAFEQLEDRKLLAVVTAYSTSFLQNLDADFITASADSTSLANGGFAVIGVHTTHIDGTIYDSTGAVTDGWSGTTGTNGALDQLANGNLVIASQDADSILFKIVNSVSGDTVVATVDIGDTGPSSNADVAALNNGNFVIVNQDFFSGSDFDIDVSLRNSVGGEITTFAIDASAATDTQPAVTALDDGGFAVAWQRAVAAETEVWSAVYNSNGSVRRAAALLDTTGTVNRNVAIESKVNGFVVAYEDNGWATGTNDITLVEFDNSGNFQAFNNISNPSFINDGSNDSTPAVSRLSNGMLAVAYGNNQFADTDTIVRLFDPVTNNIGSADSVSAGESIVDDTENPTVVGFGAGRLAVFHTNVTDSDIDGELLLGVRTSTGDAANDVITGDEFIDNMNGGEGNDTLTGAGGNDFLNGEGGNDNLIGYGGNDALFGGSGNDTMNGGVGNDAYTGGIGNDTYTFGTALGIEIDELFEGAAVGDGIDVLNFAGISVPVTLDMSSTLPQAVHVNRSVLLNLGNSFENVRGGSAGDTITGNILNNLMLGNNGNDTLDGADGNDNLVGGVGNDTLLGGNGNDTLSGDNGHDWLGGGNGNDKLRGGNNRDVLVGGAGADQLNSAAVVGSSTADDILIAGTTDFGTNAAARDAIVAAWAGPGAFAARINLLKNIGVGAGNAVKLNNATVHNDFSVDQLYGGDSLDWFFAHVAGANIDNHDAAGAEAGELVPV